MKLKITVICGVLAAALLCGCGKNTSSEPESTAPESTEVSSAESEAEESKPEINVVKETPKEIDGFLGNTVDVEPKSGDLIAEFDIKDYGTIKAVLFPEAAPLGVENFRKLCDEGFYKGLTIHRVMKNFMFQGGSPNGDGTGGEALVNGGSFGIETAQNARHFYGALCYANAGGLNRTQFYIINTKEPQDMSDELLTNFEAVVEEGLTRARTARDSGIANAENTIEYYVETAQTYQTMIDWAKGSSDVIKERYKEVGGYFGLDGLYTVFGQVYDGFDVIESISDAEVVDNGAGEISKPVQEIVINDITVSVCED